MPLHKDIVTQSRAIYTEAHYAILCAVEISHVSSYKTKHNASDYFRKNNVRIRRTLLQRYDKFLELPNFWCYFLILVHKIDYELNEFS